MIPKIIHYCWFGGKPLPEYAIKCINSWKKYFPDYEIKRWDESNFNFDECNYTKEAYNAKKWAFVSDYARFYILYHEGGIYFDTDVEVVKDFSDIVSCGSFMGQEKSSSLVSFDVAPGLGLGALPGLEIYKTILNYYNKQHFVDSNGNYNYVTVVTRITDILMIHGYNQHLNEIQKVAGIIIYTPEYFCPVNYETGKIEITENTHSIHHYSESWLSWTGKAINIISKLFIDKGNIGRVITKVLIAPFQVIEKIEQKFK